MVARTQKEIRRYAHWWLAGLLTLSLVLMVLQSARRMSQQNWFTSAVQTVTALVQRPTAAVSNGSTDFFHHISELRQADTENQQLKQQISDLQSQLRDLQTIRAENERLKSLLDLKEQNKFQMIPARVIARDPSGWFNLATINRGRSSGVQLGMPVVTKEGIVGRVIGTSLLTAQVMLITDEKAAAGGVIGNLSSTAAGSIRGLGNSSLLELTRVSGVETVKPGDPVFTTGQDGVYPPGLKVGEVVDVKSSSVTTTQTIYVKPSANIANLDEVAVLLYHAPERAAPDQTLQNQSGNADKNRGKK